MSGKLLNAVGITTEAGKADLSGPIAAEFTLKRRTAESQQRYYEEKIAELVLTQGQLAKAIAERDALVRVIHLAGAMAGNPKDANEGCRNICKLVRDTKDKLASGELRKTVA